MKDKVCAAQSTAVKSHRWTFVCDQRYISKWSGGRYEPFAVQVWGMVNCRCAPLPTPGLARVTIAGFKWDGKPLYGVLNPRGAVVAKAGGRR